MKKLVLLAAVLTSLFAGISAADADPLDKSSPKIAHGMYRDRGKYSPKIAHGMYRDRGKSSPKIAHGMYQGGNNFDEELLYILMMEELMYGPRGR